MQLEPRNSSRFTPARCAAWMTLVWMARLSRMNCAGKLLLAHDAADFGRGKEHELGPLLLEQLAHGGLVGEVGLRVGAR